jgi:hypothetical protein
MLEPLGSGGLGTLLVDGLDTTESRYLAKDGVSSHYPRTFPAIDSSYG